MSKNISAFNEQLYNFLTAYGFKQVRMHGKDGDPVPLPKDASQFSFHYTNGDYDYGSIRITTDNSTVTVFFNKSVIDDPENGIDTKWTQFLKKLKSWSLRHGQMSFKTKNLDELQYELAKQKDSHREASLLEGYFGTRNTSYTDKQPQTVKIVIKHNKNIGETDQRFRYVDKIFLENSLGERVLCPTKKPSEARAFARHLAEGGQYNDERWNHIREISEDISKLGGFVRATKTSQFNESAQTVINEVSEKYNALRGTMNKLQNSRGYNTYFESWQPNLFETDADCDYSGMFTTSRLDPRIERALPVLNKLNIKHHELSEANEFESWADGILEGVNAVMDQKIDDFVDLLTSNSKLPVGADATDIKGQLESLIDNNAHRADLFGELEDSASADPDNDAKPAILSWLQKHRNEEFFGDVIDRYEEESGDTSGTSEKEEQIVEPETPKQKEPTPQAPLATSSPQSSKDAAAIQNLMPQPMAESEIDETLGAEQIRVKQLGPTEKITKSNPLRGKLVGANESADMLARIRKLSGLK